MSVLFQFPVFGINAMRFPGIPQYCFLVIIFVFVSGRALAQAPGPSANELKKLSMEELMNIEVTSVSRRPEKLTEAASAIQVITRDEIRRSGATNVPEALRLATNLQVAQVNSSQWAISARGFNNVLANKLLVLIDGRTVYTPMYAGVFWDVQNLLLEDVDRIEVVSGPGGTLWGANAVNGVINITTRSAKNSQGLYVEGGLGSELKRYGGLRYGAKLAKDVYFRAYGMAFNRGSTMNSDTAARDGWRMGQGGFRMDWEASKNNTATLQSNFYDGTPDPDGGKPVTARGSNVLGRWTHTYSDGADSKLQLYYDQTWRDFRNGFAENLKTYDADWQDRFRPGQRHEVVWGAGARFMDHRVQNLELFAFLPGQKWLHLYSAFIQDNILLIKDRLHFTVGSKFEHNSYTGFQYQPSGRLAWTPSERQTVWAAVSRAVRNPSRLDREFNLSIAPGVPFIAGGNFQSEKLLAYEAGWRFQPQEKISFSLATFYNVYQDIRSVEPGPNILPLTFGNGVKGKTYGAELSAAYQLASWWRLRGGYTYLRKDLSLQPGSHDSNGGSAESDDPHNQYLIQSMMNIPGGFEFGVVFRYVDVLPKPYVASYTSMDVRVGWRIIKALELNMVGQNLLSDQHPEFVPSSPSPRKIQRGVYGKIVWRFLES